MNQSSEYYLPVCKMLDLFGAFRIVISKQQPQGVNYSKGKQVPRAHITYKQAEETENFISASMEEYAHEGAYRVLPIFNNNNGGVCFPVYDGKSGAVRTEDRRTLSDRALQEFGV
jgi:hypothetical protein